MVTQTYQYVEAARNGGADVLTVRTAPVTAPKAGEVRIKVEAAGVAFADVLIREGIYPDVPKAPVVPGYDVVGVIDAVGTGVNEWRIGDRVAALTRIGGYAERVTVPAADCVVVPQSVDAAQAVSLVLNYLTAYQMLRRTARVEAGEWILVHGAAGGVGTALLELGQAMGLRMIGTASKRKHDVLRGFGAHPIDYQSEDFVERTLAISGGGVDAVFDAVGGTQLARSYAVLRGGGRLIGYGMSAATVNGRTNIPRAAWNLLRQPRYKILDMMQPNRMVAGFNVYTLKHQRPDWYRADLTALIEMLAQGKIKPMVAERIALAEARRAHELLNQAALSGKIVLVMG